MGPVWFVAGAFGGEITRECTVPRGKALFVPLLNTTFGAAVSDCEPTKPGVRCDVTQLRAMAAVAMDAVSIKASLDSVPLLNLQQYRAQSPVFSVTLPEDNILGIPAGTYEPMVSDGYWLMLRPLTPGAHTLQWHGRITGGVFAGFEVQVTYSLTVGP